MSPSRWDMPPIHLQGGDPETESVPTLHAPGLLGSRFTIIDPQRSAPGTTTASAGRSKRYQLIRTDSTMAVAPFAGAVAWWADRARYVVTTSPTTNSRNDIAGIFRRVWAAVGDYMCVQVTGPGIVKMIDAVTGGEGNMVSGASIIPSSTAGKADVVALGTAPTYVPLGRISAPISYNVAAREILVDLDVPETT